MFTKFFLGAFIVILHFVCEASDSPEQDLHSESHEVEWSRGETQDTCVLTGNCEKPAHILWKKDCKNIEITAHTIKITWEKKKDSNNKEILVFKNALAIGNVKIQYGDYHIQADECLYTPPCLHGKKDNQWGGIIQCFGNISMVDGHKNKIKGDEGTFDLANEKYNVKGKTKQASVSLKPNTIDPKKRQNPQP